MKRTYVKLSSEILMVETESSFMGASVVLSKTVTVEPYQNGWEKEGLTKDTGLLDDGTFGVTFD